MRRGQERAAQGGRERGAIAPSRRAAAGAGGLALGSTHCGGSGRRDGRRRAERDRRERRGARARRGAGARDRRPARGAGTDATPGCALPTLGEGADHDGCPRRKARVGAAAGRVRLEVRRGRGARAIRIGRARGAGLRRRAARRGDGIPVPAARRDHGRGQGPRPHRGRPRRSGARARRAVRARAELARVARSRARRGSALPAGRNARGRRHLDLRRGAPGVWLRCGADLDARRQRAARGRLARPAERRDPSGPPDRLRRLPGPDRGDARVPVDVRPERATEDARGGAAARPAAWPVLLASHPDRDRRAVRADSRAAMGARDPGAGSIGDRSDAAVCRPGGARDGAGRASPGPGGNPRAAGCHGGTRRSRDAERCGPRDRQPGSEGAQGSRRHGLCAARGRGRPRPDRERGVSARDDERVGADPARGADAAHRCHAQRRDHRLRLAGGDRRARTRGSTTATSPSSRRRSSRRAA